MRIIIVLIITVYIYKIHTKVNLFAQNVHVSKSYNNISVNAIIMLTTYIQYLYLFSICIKKMIKCKKK